MRVLVTGAGGVVGRLLCDRLLRGDPAFPRAPLQLLLLDQSLGTLAEDPRVRLHVGDIADPRLLRRALADGVQCVFHLADVDPGLAERDAELGQRVNVGATLELFNQLREQPRPPVVVFASSSAVYGANLRDAIDEAAPARPVSSYGTHKLIGELLLRDFSRQGCVDGRAVRLPSIFGWTSPRPPRASSAEFEGEHRHALAEVGMDSSRHACWWMSDACAVTNLLHAAVLSIAPDDSERTWTPNAIRATAADIVEASTRILDEEKTGVVRSSRGGARRSMRRSRDAGRSKAADAGFESDGSVHALVSNALRTFRSR